MVPVPVTLLRQSFLLQHLLSSHSVCRVTVPSAPVSIWKLALAAFSFWSLSQSATRLQALLAKLSSSACKSSADSQQASQMFSHSSHTVYPSLSHPAHIHMGSSLSKITGFFLLSSTMSTNYHHWHAEKNIFLTKYSCRMCRGRAFNDPRTSRTD